MNALSRLQTSPNYRWVILVSTTISQTSISICSQGLQPLGPYFKDSFGLTAFQIGVLVSMMEVGMFLMVLLAGRMVDIYGERLVLAVGGVGCGLLIITTSLSLGFLLTCVLLLLAGCFSATAVPAGSKAVMSWFPLQNRGFAMGVRQTGIPLGGALAAILLPPLAHDNGWPLALLVAGLIALGGTAICFLTYREFKEPDETVFGRSVNSGPPRSIRQVIGNRNVLLVSIGSAFLIVGQYTLVIYIVFYLNDELGISLLVAASYLAVTHLSGAAGRIVWGIVSDRMFGGSRRNVLILAIVISIIMTLIFAVQSRETPAWFLYLLVAIFGFSIVGWTGMWVALLSELAGRNQSGTALGFGMTIMQVGKVVGPPLLGLLHDLTHSYRPGWFTLTLVLGVGLYLIYLIKEKRAD